MSPWGVVALFAAQEKPSRPPGAGLGGSHSIQVAVSLF